MWYLFCKISENLLGFSCGGRVSGHSPTDFKRAVSYPEIVGDLSMPLIHLMLGKMIGYTMNDQYWNFQLRD